MKTPRRRLVIPWVAGSWGFVVLLALEITSTPEVRIARIAVTLAGLVVLMTLATVAFAWASRRRARRHHAAAGRDRA